MARDWAPTLLTVFFDDDRHCSSFGLTHCSVWRSVWRSSRRRGRRTRHASRHPSASLTTRQEVDGEDTSHATVLESKTRVCTRLTLSCQWPHREHFFAARSDCPHFVRAPCSLRCVGARGRAARLECGALPSILADRSLPRGVPSPQIAPRSCQKAPPIVSPADRAVSPGEHERVEMRSHGAVKRN